MESVTFDYGSIRSEEHARVIDILSHSFVVPAGTRRFGSSARRSPVQLRLGERALAALYTGVHSARALRLMGELEADDEMLEVLDGWFAGPLPTMREHF
jgi:predicted acetyltransferase